MNQTTVKNQEIPADTYLIDTRAILRENFLADNRPWVVAYSVGKDSTLVLQLVYEMLLSLTPEQKKLFISLLRILESKLQI
jgi:3'-phosphoadenosine 5'-phosphosulfate sulfotransferase (PAPS reductase)/FAD synthetase